MNEIEHKAVDGPETPEAETPATEEATPEAPAEETPATDEGSDAPAEDLPPTE
jgi:hypothetical protein